MIAIRRPKPSGTAEPSDSEPQAPVYAGCLQGVGNGHALGWCWDPAIPQDRVRIAIAVDGEIVAEGLADVARPDVADYGDGAHGFVIALPDSLQAPGRHRVLALAGTEKLPIATAPSFWHEASSGNGWSDVVFEAGQPSSNDAPSITVPEPPNSPDRQAVSYAGWLFDAREFESSSYPTLTDLDAIVTSLTTTAAACAALGINYLPVIVPAKRCIVGTAPPLDRSWLAALVARLRDVDEVELMDLLPVLHQADRHGLSYHRTDADWNDLGAFFVARALLKEAHKWVPALRPPTLADLHLQPAPGYRGTLADAPRLELLDGQPVRRKPDVDTPDTMLDPAHQMVDVEDGVTIDVSHLGALRMPVESHLAAATSGHLRVYANPARDEEARLSIVGENCCLPLLPWLAEPNRRTTFLWSRALPLYELELDLPRLVFHLIGEADLPRCTEPSVLMRPLASSKRDDRHKIIADDYGTSEIQHLASPAVSSKVVEQTPRDTNGHADLDKNQVAASVSDPATSTATRPTAPTPALEANSNSKVQHGPAHDDAPRIHSSSWLPPVLLGAGILIFSLLMLYDTRQLGFWQDEWSFVTTRLSWSPGTFLHAFNQQPMMLTVLVYKLLLTTAGLQHTWPYRLALLSMHGLCVTLLWLFARKRLGGWLALVPAGLLLVLGAAWEDLTLALQINYLGSVAAGLGALLCLDRDDRRGDLLACALLVIAWMWSSVGVALILGVGVELAWSGRARRKWWIAVLPLALYGAWYLGYGSSEAELSNVLQIPSYLVAGSSATLGGIVGLEGLGTILLVVCTALVVRQFLRPRGLSARAAMGIGGFLAFWVITALNRAQYAQPTASRYMYPAAAFVLIAAVALIPRFRIPARGYLLIVAAMAGIWLSGYSQLVTAAHNRDDVDTEVKAELGAVDIGGPAVSGAVIPDEHHAPVLTVAAYRNAERKLHSRAGFTVSQMLHTDEQNRELIDQKLISWEGIQPSPATEATTPGSGPRPAVEEGAEAVLSVNGSCETLAPTTSKANHTLLVDPGNALLLSAVEGQAEIGFSTRRFATGFAPATTVLAGVKAPRALRFPRDASTLPWHVLINSASPITICQEPMG